MTKICVDCGKEEVFERRRCKECAKEFNRERVKRYYKEQMDKGIKKNRYGIGICLYCGKEMFLNKREQICHKECLYLLYGEKKDYNSYPRDKNGNMIGNSIFKKYIELPENYIVHHVDENPENNSIENLLGIPRKEHSKLHGHLRRIRSVWLKNHISMDENCWKLLREKETTTWLEMTSVNVLRIPSIGQSAAEPLLNEEGSETKHILSETSNVVDEDIVQTTTMKIGSGN